MDMNWTVITETLTFAWPVRSSAKFSGTHHVTVTVFILIKKERNFKGSYGHGENTLRVIPDNWNVCKSSEKVLWQCYKSLVCKSLVL